jgi:septal ring factor EnvC (AmiA/AmiB activator)
MEEDMRLMEKARVNIARINVFNRDYNPNEILSHHHLHTPDTSKNNKLNQWATTFFVAFISIFVTIMLFAINGFTGPLASAQEQIKQLNKQYEKVLANIEEVHKDKMQLEKRITCLEIKIEQLRNHNGSIVENNTKFREELIEMKQRVTELEQYIELQQYVRFELP